MDEIGLSLAGIAMMEGYQWTMVAVGLLGFVVQAFVLAIGGTWKLAQMEHRLTGAMTKHRREIDEAAYAAKQEAFDLADRVRRETGESIASIQTRMSQLEIWNRDNFVRRDSFQMVMSEAKQAWDAQSRMIDRRLDRIDEKLDELRDRPRT